MRRYVYAIPDGDGKSAAIAGRTDSPLDDGALRDRYYGDAPIVCDAESWRVERREIGQVSLPPAECMRVAEPDNGTVHCYPAEGEPYYKRIFRDAREGEKPTSWCFRWVRTGARYELRRALWGTYHTAFHGGGRIYSGYSWFAAMRAAAAHTSESCTCGCAGVEEITSGEPAGLNPGNDSPYALRS